MRIVGEVPHPSYKISILQNMGRFTLKIEADAIEQSYKLRESDKIQNASDVMALVTPAFLKKVDRVFLDLGDNLMHLLDLSTEDDDDDVPMVEGIL